MVTRMQLVFLSLTLYFTYHRENMDIESANCKLRLSECSRRQVCPIERPLKCNIVIENLAHLVRELHTVFSQDDVHVQYVSALMNSYKSNKQDWERYAKFDRYRYTRNLVDDGNGAFNIIILCWGPGHASAIHDHADSHCFMKMLEGNLEEVRFDWPANVTPEVFKDKPEPDVPGTQANACTEAEEDERSFDADKMVEVKRTRLEVNDVCYINDALGLHRMENPSHADGAVSLHLYCPPFNSCRVFDGRTGRPSEVKVTFWSKFGRKVKLIDNNDISEAKND